MYIYVQWVMFGNKLEKIRKNYKNNKRIMKKLINLSKIMLVLFFLLAATNAMASEITGDLSSNIEGGSTVGGTIGGDSDDEGSTVGGTIGGSSGGSSITGTVGGGTGGGGGGGGGGIVGGTVIDDNGGEVLGASTGGTNNTGGEVLGTTNTPGFPSAGLGPENTTGLVNLIALILFLTALVAYSYHGARKSMERNI